MSAAHAGSSFFARDLNLKMRTLPSFTVKKKKQKMNHKAWFTLQHEQKHARKHKHKLGKPGLTETIPFCYAYAYVMFMSSRLSSTHHC